jgi:hypothetical protein
MTKLVITACPALDPLNKARLEGTLFACVHSPADPLLLDCTLDEQSVAEHLAVLFPELHSLASKVMGWDDQDSVNPEWFIPLIKSYYALDSNEGHSGATANQLIQRASREARNNDTREIYLGLFVLSLWSTVRITHIIFKPCRFRSQLP